MSYIKLDLCEAVRESFERGSTVKVKHAYSEFCKPAIFSIIT